METKHHNLSTNMKYYINVFMQYSVDINTAVLLVECMIFEYSIKDEMYYKIKAALQT